MELGRFLVVTYFFSRLCISFFWVRVVLSFCVFGMVRNRMGVKVVGCWWNVVVRLSGFVFFIGRVWSFFFICIVWFICVFGFFKELVG